MKKILSFALILVLCFGIFAGCAPKEDAALNAAGEYLYAMYKDAEEKTAVDYTVVSQVRIDDVVYPITWTTDKAENVQITAGENNMTTVKLVPGLEDIAYTLTATLKNADGLEVSVSFNHYIPKADGLPATLADGTYIILAGNLTMSSLSADKSYGYPTTTEVTVADGTATGYVAADVLTIKNVDGGYTIQDAQGRYFYLKGTYNSFNVDAAAPAEGHVFSILVKEGKYLIQNTLAMKTLAYSTSYSSWGCYAEVSEDHTSLVEIIAVSAPAGTPDNTPDASTPATTPATTPTTKPATTTPATKPSGNTGTSTGKLAASLDMKGTTNLKSVNTTKTVYSANGITYTNDKASSTTDNYSNQSSYSARAYQGSTIKIEYTGMTRIVFHLDDYEVSGKTYMAGFDGMTVSGATITRDGTTLTIDFAKATNAFQSTELASQTRINSIDVYTGTTGSTTTTTPATKPATTAPATTAPATKPATTPSTTPTGWTKVSSLNNGDKIVIVNPASNMALSMTKTGYYNNGVDVSSNFNSITNEEIFVVTKNGDGSVTLTSVSGKKVALAESYSSLNEEGVNDKWTISDAGNGNVYLLNAGRDLYLEWYASKNNWSAYNPDELTADYVLAFYKQA